jgi:hypothetical protein
MAGRTGSALFGAAIPDRDGERTEVNRAPRGEDGPPCGTLEKRTSKNGDRAKVGMNGTTFITLDIREAGALHLRDVLGLSIHPSGIPRWTPDADARKWQSPEDKHDQSEVT